MSIEVVYTAESTATGGGRDGHVKSSDGRIDLDTRPPKEAGGSGEGANPELLFSAGYAACFLGALRLVAKNDNVKLDDATAVTTRVGFGKDSEGGFGINADLIGYLPGLEQRQADDLMKQAHQVCPYSKATRGNIDVTLSAKV
ncbi:organic hydroperoxide resistance protein [Mycobacterium sp.]|uniref:organic hydroperoxide resistance protein n=1 Tax=Mycobacterium sp. TaxID=1785 RepID=UPI002D399D30|nr:organic hydroperoxide resistance protein [Mycobacterium sp.]HZA11133.1 organic hydroperoxide resistance protein [Mycobacterium sp.]